MIYGDDGFFFRRYHDEAGGDPAATVPPWNVADGSRTVTFTKRMSLPGVIERLLGAAAAASCVYSLTFEEKQRFRYDVASGEARVRSNPALVSPRSDSFKTEVTVYLSPFDDDRSRCAMRAKLAGESSVGRKRVPSFLPCFIPSACVCSRLLDSGVRLDASSR